MTVYGPWMQTVSGKAVDLLDPQPDQICIEDIAYSLARINRYLGHTRILYSVAQHSVLVSQRVASRFHQRTFRDVATTAALHGLLHDAHEAYVGDITSPVKRAILSVLVEDTSLDPVKILAKRFDDVIFRKWGAVDPDVDLSGITKHSDIELLITEKTQLYPTEAPRPWLHSDVLPLPITIAEWSPEEAEREFMSAFTNLTRTA